MTTEPGVSEARRLRDDDLAQLGWTRRFTAAPPRLVEVRDLYESLGHEVLLDPLLEGELDGVCSSCSLALNLFRVIYTRASASWRDGHETRSAVIRDDGRSG